MVTLVTSKSPLLLSLLFAPIWLHMKGLGFKPSDVWFTGDAQKEIKGILVTVISPPSV
jgi:hypothetical protein